MTVQKHFLALALYAVLFLCMVGSCWGVGGVGDLSFVLEWSYDSSDEGPDIDLHVRDTNGAWWDYHKAHSEHFDYDDQGQSGSGDGGGPERAYWRSPPEGDYLFRAKWYGNSSAATKADITIHVYEGSTRIYSRSITLSPDLIQFTWQHHYTIEPPNQAPWVSVASPSENSLIDYGRTITLQASAGDSDGTVQEVKFYVDGSYYRTDITAPFAVSWPAYSSGLHTIYAVAVDDDGTSTTSSVRTFRVNVPNDPPRVWWIQPANNQSVNVAETVTLIAGADDPDGSVSRVEFYVDGAYLGPGSASSDSYSREWTPSSGGSHVLTAKAVDNRNTPRSSSVTVHVENRADMDVRSAVMEPNPIVAGASPTNLVFSLANNGPLPLTPSLVPFFMEFRLSRDVVLEPDDALLCAITNSGDYLPGATFEWSLSAGELSQIVIPSGARGDYTLFATAVYGGGEIIEDPELINNTVAIPVHVGYLVDLEVSNVEFLPEKPAAIDPGEHPQSIAFDLHNHGVANLAGLDRQIKIDVVLSRNEVFGDLDDISVLTEAILLDASTVTGTPSRIDLHPGTLEKVEIPTGSAGDYYAFVHVNHGSESTHVDPDISNNSAHNPGLVEVTGGVDADVRVKDLYLNPTQLAPGYHPSFVQFKVENLEVVDLTGVPLVAEFLISTNGVFDSNEVVGIGQCSIDIPMIGAGGEMTVTLDESQRNALSIPSDASGSMYLYVYVQHAASSRYLDPEWANNKCRMADVLWVTDGSVCDLEVFDLQFFPKELDPGDQPARISFRVRNNGPAELDHEVPFYLLFYLDRDLSAEEAPWLGTVPLRVDLKPGKSVYYEISDPEDLGDFIVPDIDGYFWPAIVSAPEFGSIYDNVESNNKVADTTPVLVRGGTNADIYVANLLWEPSSIRTGAVPSSVEFHVGNKGPAHLKAPNTNLTASLYLSVDDSFDLSDFFVKDIELYPHLNVDESTLIDVKSNTLSTVAMSAVPRGQYYVVVVMDHGASSSLSDPDFTDNEAASAEPIWIHRACVTQPYITNSVVQPGQQFVQIEWEGFPGETARIELRKSDEVYTVSMFERSEDGNGDHWWNVPEDMQAGEYSLYVGSLLPVDENTVWASLPHSFIVDTPPELIWLPPVINSTNGVVPSQGFRDRYFRFQVIYRDAEGHAPEGGSPFLFVFDSFGNEVEGCPFPMSRDDEEPFESGSLYSCDLFLSKGEYSHRFEASDEPGLKAFGEATGEAYGPKVERVTRGLFVGSTDTSEFQYLFVTLERNIQGKGDAIDMRNAFRGLGGFFSPSDDLDLLLYDFSHASLAESDILNRLDEFRPEMEPGDTFVFYYAGHGLHDPDGDDSEPGPLFDNKDDEVLAINSISFMKDDDLADAFSSWNEDINILAIIDACHSGGFWQDDPYAADRDLAVLPNAALIAACAESEWTVAGMPTSEGWGGGVLTQALQLALSKDLFDHYWADLDKDGIVTFNELRIFVYNSSHRGEFDGIVGYLRTTNDWNRLVQYDPVSMSPVVFRNPGFDEDALGGAVFDETVRPSSPDSVTLDNTTPLDDETVTCSADGSVSIDGSAIFYRYQWQELAGGESDWTRAQCNGKLLPASVSVAGNSYRCRVWAMDENGVSSSNAISQVIVVLPSADTPIINSVTNKSVDAGATYLESLTCSSTLSNSWYLLKGAGGMVLNRQTGELVYSNAVPGTYAMQARVENSVGSDEVEWTLTVGSGQGPWRLDVDIDPPGAGWVYGVGNPVADGDQRTLVAMPTLGFKFDHWSGTLSGTSPSGTVTVASDVTAIAHFAQDYDTWVHRNFTPENRTNALVSGWMADPDGDGVPNGSDFAFVSAPIQLTSLDEIIGQSTNSTISLTFARRTSPQGLNYTLEMTTNLVDWTQAPYAVAGQMNSDTLVGVEFVTIEVALPWTNSVSACFVRMKAERE